LPNGPSTEDTEAALDLRRNGLERHRIGIVTARPSAFISEKTPAAFPLAFAGVVGGIHGHGTPPTAAALLRQFAHFAGLEIRYLRCFQLPGR
jgi:hypothetical protein